MIRDAGNRSQYGTRRIGRRDKISNNGFSKVEVITEFILFDDQWEVAEISLRRS